MRTIRLVIVVFLETSLLWGCATISHRYVPKQTNVSEPTLNSVNVAHVGEHLVRQGTYSEHDAIFVRSEVDVGTFSGYTIRPGYYVKEGENEDSDFFRPSPHGSGGSVVRNPLMDEWKWVQAYKDRHTICIVTIFNVSVCTRDAPFDRTKQPVASPNSFQQTLIYSGKVGNKLKIGYREFSASLARPAFNNDVEYDLSQSNVIGYKGARIEVIEATNEFIKYKVLRNFNTATQ